MSRIKVSRLAPAVDGALVRHQAEEQRLHDAKADAVHRSEDEHPPEVLRTWKPRQRKASQWDIRSTSKDSKDI